MLAHTIRFSLRYFIYDKKKSGRVGWVAGERGVVLKYHCFTCDLSQILFMAL